MPAEGIAVAPRDELLTYEEIESIVRVASKLGVWQIRLTGGEPLVRQDLPRLVSQIAMIPTIEDLALTTNAILLDQQAKPLYESGLRRLNISLDALDPVKFAEVTRRDQYDKVIAGIEAAKSAGFEGIKINVVSLRGVTDSEIIPFGNFARETGLEVRLLNTCLSMPQNLGNVIKSYLQAKYNRFLAMQFNRSFLLQRQPAVLQPSMSLKMELVALDLSRP